jgi:hypothetical protein
VLIALGFTSVTFRASPRHSDRDAQTFYRSRQQRGTSDMKRLCRTHEQRLSQEAKVKIWIAITALIIVTTAAFSSMADDDFEVFLFWLQ